MVPSNPHRLCKTCGREPIFCDCASGETWHIDRATRRATLSEQVERAAPSPELFDDAELHAEKVWYKRFWALQRNVDLVEIYRRFGHEPFRRSSVLEGLEDMLDAHEIRGERAVEIGTWKGLTALVLARRFAEVVTIDITEDPDRQRIAAAVGITNIRWLTVRDNQHKAQVIRDIGDFDFAYVDGDHARDTDIDFAMVGRCGNVLLHEYWPPQPSVVRLVDRLRANGGRVDVEGKLALWRCG
jgi:hypothetical protein